MTDFNGIWLIQKMQFSIFFTKISGIGPWANMIYWCKNVAQPVWLSSVSKKDTFQTFVLFLDRSDGILSSFKIVVIFNNSSADFVLISADVLLEKVMVFSEMMIA